MDPLHALGRDLRHAVRSSRREPAFVAGVVLTFALAIGANAAMFGIVRRLMLAPPPGIHEPARVATMHLELAGPRGDTYRMNTTSYPAFRAVAAVRAALAGVAAVRADSMTTGRGAELSRVAAVQATGEYFAALGVRPALGRVFGAEDDVLPAGSDVVVLGHAFWRRRFAGDAGVLGRELVLDDRPFTIVGVAPRGFNGTSLGAADVYVPLSAALRAQGGAWWSTPGMRLVSIVVRLRDETSPDAAAATLASALRESEDDPHGDRLASVSLESIVPGRSTRETPQARVALWLTGVSLVVLLVATANVATLVLLRAARRRRDTAVRVALGAGRARLVRQSLAESVLLALVGCTLGLLVAHWLADVVRASLMPDLAADERLVDARVLVASIVAASAAGLLAGLAPLATLGRRDLSLALRTGGGHGSSGRFLGQHALVAIQVMLCTVLLVGAGLFVRSLHRVRTQDLGFSTARLLDVRLDFQRSAPAADRDEVHEEAARRIAALPGASRVTVVQGMPFSSHHIPPISIPGHTEPPTAGGQLPIMYGATPAYLEMMGVTLREGRLLTDRDREGSALVVLVNETMARTAWPGESALGKCVRAGHAGSPMEPGYDPMAGAATLPCREVVGVVRDSRARSLRLVGSEGKLMQYYIPFGQLPGAPFPDVPVVHGILVRTDGEPARLAGAVQRLVQGTSALPVYARVRPYQSLIDPQLRSWRLGATLFLAFGALALGIAAVGLFAVVSYLVAQRTSEIGVRLALGGTSMRVARLVVRDAVVVTAAGAAAGALVALVAAPLVEEMLFETSARDPVSLLVAAGALLVVSIGASAIPAWRAGRVSPLTVLRADA